MCCNLGALALPEREDSCANEAKQVSLHHRTLKIAESTLKALGKTLGEGQLSKLFKNTIFATTALGLGVGMGGVAAAQDAESAVDTMDIVVTARRVEERLQDVPISITVFNQEQLSDNNVTTTADLATYTPSLSANNRYGAESASFSIRGFAQEQRTTASVATYFAEVVTPRGGPTINGGDGAGPGNLFDLQNVQVLMGPQGTLFGRNTTGGAVLLVPQRPTDEFGGYIEASGGDYDMQRLQGVLNVPLTDSARLRIGMDRMEREGYLDNQSDIGPDHFGDVNYESYRVSFVADLAPNLENYSILSYTHSLTNGNLSRYVACNPTPTTLINLPSSISCDTSPMLQGTQTNQEDFYDVWNGDADPQFSQNVWQFINTTTWDLSDTLTLRNILSYAEAKGNTRGDVFGTYFDFPGSAPFFPAGVGTFANAGQTSDLDGGHQSTFSEEIQLQGRSSDSRLVWQAGVYYEESDPLAETGSISGSRNYCTDTAGNDPTTWNCFPLVPNANPALSTTNMTGSVGSLGYINQAVYAQATYELTERLKLTAGYRYTWDRTSSLSRQFTYTYAAALGGANNALGNVCVDPAADPTSFPRCEVRDSQHSEAPTWTLGLDYFLTDDDMVYAKYTRGYRQGSVNIFGLAGFQTFGQEQVDSYELGLKSSFGGMFPGIFNVALFYNDLEDAQLQTSFIPSTIPTTAILNAPSVTTYGAEISAALELFEGFDFHIAYGYLNTNLDSAPVVPPSIPVVLTSYQTDQDLPYMPENKVSVGATYTLPLPESIGEVSLGGVYSWVDEQLADLGTPYGTIDSYGVLNLNADWDHIFGSAVDAQLFVTNATDEEYMVYMSPTWAAGFVSGVTGQPRMVGARLRYSFGGEAN